MNPNGYSVFIRAGVALLATSATLPAATLVAYDFENIGALLAPDANNIADGINAQFLTLNNLTSGRHDYSSDANRAITLMPASVEVAQPSCYSVSTALEKAAYLSLRFTVDAGYTLSIKTLSLQAAGGGPASFRAFYVFSNLSGFTAPPGDAHAHCLLSARMKHLGNNGTLPPRADGLKDYSVTLSHPAFQNIAGGTEVEFRFYIQTDGTGRSVDLGGITLNGTSAPIPGSSINARAAGAYYDTPRSSSGAVETTDALRRLDAAFSGVAPWVASLADEETGGFFESTGLKQGREEIPYAADIQSTYFAVLILNDAGWLAGLPPSRKESLVRFFQSRQSPETGYFSDPAYPEMKDSDRTMGRALMFSVNGLRHLDAKPLHPLPGERKTGTGGTPTRHASLTAPVRPPERPPAPSAPAHLASVAAFREWLDARPWDNAWTALDQLSSQARLISAQEPALQKALVAEALRNVLARQSPKTGLVGGGSFSVRLSGAFKLVSFCNTVGEPVPQAERLRDTTLAWYRGEPVTDKIFFIRNAAEMLAALVRQTKRPLSPEELRAAIDTSLTELSRYHCPDGAFSSFAGRYYISPNDLYLNPRRVARAGPQSDMNGTANAWAMRKALHRLADVSLPRMATPDEPPAPEFTRL